MATVSAAETPAILQVYTSGSVSGPLTEVAAHYTQETGQAVKITSGAAGLLRQHIEKGADADVYVSANLANAQHLAQDHVGSPAVIVARNRLCLVARSPLQRTADNLLDTVSNPSVKIGTSTPGDDPGGDYAWAWFASLDAAHPGAGKVLPDKAQQRVGGAVVPKIPAHTNALVYFLQQDQVDAFVSYCSSKQPDPKLAPGLMKVVIPADRSVPVNYAISALLRPDQPARQIDAWRFANVLMTPDAQARLPRYGFIPVTGIDAGNASATSERTDSGKGRYRSSSLVGAQRLSDLSKPSHRAYPVHPGPHPVPEFSPASLPFLSADGRRATPCRHVHRARAAPVAQTHGVVLLAARGTGWGESRRPHSMSR